MEHANGQNHLVKGLWTRQRGKSKTILDYACISEEHLATVLSLVIDEEGNEGVGADHNWMFFYLRDNFVKKKRVWNVQARKPKWKIADDQDWSMFQEAVRKRINEVSLDTLSVNEQASLVSSTLLSAGMDTIGQTVPKAGSKSKPILYPRNIVEEIKLNRLLESQWKTGVANGEAVYWSWKRSQ